MRTKNRFKPLYKKFIKLRENSQNRQKILKFKKQKWKSFVEFYKRKLKWYKKFRPQNQNRYLISKYPNRYASYSNRYKRTLQSYKNFSLFYGGLKKTVLKRERLNIKKKKIKNLNVEFLKLFEKRLDITLYGAKFCHSLRSAQQLIVHGKVSVNNKIVKSKSFILKQGDLIAINPQYFELIQSNIRMSNMWPIPPKHLLINYKTMQIIFGDLNNTNFFLLYPFYLNLEKILNNFHYQ